MAEVAEPSLVTVTFSAADIWLIGSLSEDMPRMKLPNHQRVPDVFLHHNKINGKTIRDSSRCAVRKILWAMTRIPLSRSLQRRTER